MIREIQRRDLNGDYFKLLAQLSGVARNLSETEVNLLWGEYERDNNRVTFVYHDGVAVIGTATVLIEHKFLHCGSKVGHIEDVTVDLGFRLGGIGKALIECCIEACKLEGCYKAILDCSNKNVGFYERCGFRVAENCMRIDLLRPAASLSSGSV